MPRSNRPRRSRKDGSESTELNIDVVRIGIRKTVIKNGVEYIAQATAGTNADDGKTWLCPHCNMTINKGTAHTVAWDAHRDISSRRHFHNNCWNSFQGPLL